MGGRVWRLVAHCRADRNDRVLRRGGSEPDGGVGPRPELPFPANVLRSSRHHCQRWHRREGRVARLHPLQRLYGIFYIPVHRVLVLEPRRMAGRVGFRGFCWLLRRPPDRRYRSVGRGLGGRSTNGALWHGRDIKRQARVLAPQCSLHPNWHDDPPTRMVRVQRRLDHEHGDCRGLTDIDARRYKHHHGCRGRRARRCHDLLPAEAQVGRALRLQRRLGRLRVHYRQLPLRVSLGSPLGRRCRRRLLWPGQLSALPPPHRRPYRCFPRSRGLRLLGRSCRRHLPSEQRRDGWASTGPRVLCAAGWGPFGLCLLWLHEPFRLPGPKASRHVELQLARSAQRP
mmetsp:Transcript_21128/g.60057  ORF Transcript_21128/g.60057 Transcript_21128/m.60057 type:complete len:341 (+) Transcript_21128:380-1402(+)